METTTDSGCTIWGTTRGRILDVLALAIIFGLSGVVMFWNIGHRYLWQDEAATAVLAERMLTFGRPLAYDGRNLITMDFTPERDAEGFAERIRDSEAAVRYYADRGDYKADMTWIGHPWGQFILAAASLGTFGHGTWQARAPFALCGVLTVVVLYLFIQARFNDRLMAFVAALLLLANVYWVLHMRQCRYYAPSSLLLLLTVIAYLRWQDARRLSGLVFVATAWLWFQFDYGTIWPVLGVLAVDSLLRRRRSVATSIVAFSALAAVVLPWIVYYELSSRLKDASFNWWERFATTAFNVNQFVIPIALLVAATGLLWTDRRVAFTVQRQSLALCLFIVIALLVWTPTVAPAPFLRYVVTCAPLAGILMAYVAVRVAEIVGERLSAPGLAAPLAVTLALLTAVTPWIAAPTRALIPQRFNTVDETGWIVRAEWGTLFRSLGRSIRDPNRELVELLRPRLAPSDEVLINYEDIPLMFYLPHRIRGGMPCFRLAEPGDPPRFLVMRTHSTYAPYQWDALVSYARRHAWSRLDNDIPIFYLSNCPDPLGNYANIEPLGTYQIGERKSGGAAEAGKPEGHGPPGQDAQP